MRDPGGAPQQNFFEFGYENIFKVLKILSWVKNKVLNILSWEIKLENTNKTRCTSTELFKIWLQIYPKF